jgi:hypothetical protein
VRPANEINVKREPIQTISCIHSAVEWQANPQLRGRLYEGRIALSTEVAESLYLFIGLNCRFLRINVG